ncbi:MAG: hypothetical protein LBJ91_03040 [Clostridiales Family XIII bacterium]|nr:hypothetical protein [Clostridiales Family XIII bacterium]
MTSRERMLAALRNKKPDVLPVTTHHLMKSFLDMDQGGLTEREFFDKYGFDSIRWANGALPVASAGGYAHPSIKQSGYTDLPLVVSDAWSVSVEETDSVKYHTLRYTIETPRKTLDIELQSNEYTAWLTVHPVKEKSDIDLLADFLPDVVADHGVFETAKSEIGDRGIVRSHIPSTVDIYGQPGCWQDACCLVGTEQLIIESFDDPAWVHYLLGIIRDHKLTYIHSLLGAGCDIIELGGGDGCTSVISPKMFDEFVAPYDKELIDAAHTAGQRITYHLCGKFMPLLSSIRDMGPDALETLTPPGMGGDAEPSVVRDALGDRMCLIGGFDQNEYFMNSTPDETREAVAACFEGAASDGGYIIAPSDHFFHAKDELLRAFVTQAHAMEY